jgi:ankyrin repeat protein
MSDICILLAITLCAHTTIAMHLSTPVTLFATPLEIAVRANDPVAIKQIIDYPTHKGKNAYPVNYLLVLKREQTTNTYYMADTVLHLACLLAHTDAVAELLRCHLVYADVPNNYGRTALHSVIIASKLHVNSSQYKSDILTILHNLLEHRADVNYMDHDGNTPLHLAAMPAHHFIKTAQCYEHDWCAIPALLLCYKANYTIKNNRGLTPFAIAKQHRNVPFLRACWNFVFEQRHHLIRKNEQEKLLI